MSQSEGGSSAPCGSHGSSEGDNGVACRVIATLNFLVKGSSEDEVLRAVSEHIAAPYCCSKTVTVVGRQVDLRRHSGRIATSFGGVLSMDAAIPSDTSLESGLAYGETPRKPERTTGMFVTHCQQVLEELVATDDGVVPVRVLQDARVVCSRILSTDELNKLGLVQAGPWGQLESGNGSANCIAEFEQIRRVERLTQRLSTGEFASADQSAEETAPADEQPAAEPAVVRVEDVLEFRAAIQAILDSETANYVRFVRPQDRLLSNKAYWRHDAIAQALMLLEEMVLHKQPGGGR